MMINDHPENKKNFLQLRVALDSCKHVKDGHVLAFDETFPSKRLLLSREQDLWSTFDRLRTRFGFFDILPGYTYRKDTSRVWLGGRGAQGRFAIEIKKDETLSEILRKCWDDLTRSTMAEFSKCRSQQPGTEATDADNRQCQQNSAGASSLASREEIKHDYKTEQWQKRRGLMRKLTQEQRATLQGNWASYVARNQGLADNPAQMEKIVQMGPQVLHGQPAESGGLGRETSNDLSKASEAPCSEHFVTGSSVGGQTGDSERACPLPKACNDGITNKTTANDSINKKLRLEQLESGTLLPTKVAPATQDTISDTPSSTTLYTSPEKTDSTLDLEDIEEVVGWDWEDLAGQSRDEDDYVVV